MRVNWHGTEMSHRLLNITLSKFLAEIIAAKGWHIGGTLQVKISF